MLRILHLLDPHDGQEPMLACRAAMSIAEAAHALWLVTDSIGERCAAAAGLHSTDRVGTRIGRAESAGGGLRALLNHRTDDLGEPAPDLVQCWSVRMLAAARAAFGKRVLPRCALLARPPLHSGKSARDSRALDDTTLLTLDLMSREAWAPLASSGRGALRMRDNIRLAPAPPLPKRCPADASISRKRAREALGLEDADVAVLLLADPPAAADAMRFAFQIGLQHVGGVRIVGLLPRGTTNARRGDRFVAGHGRRWGTLASALPIESLIAAADVSVWDAPDDGKPTSGATLLCASLAAGVPVVAAAHPISQAMLSALPECLARDASTRAVASRLFDFASDGALRTRVRASALALVSGMRERDLYRRTQLALWRERANVPIIRPGLPIPPALALAVV